MWILQRTTQHQDVSKSCCNLSTWAVVRPSTSYLTPTVDIPSITTIGELPRYWNDYHPVSSQELIAKDPNFRTTLNFLLGVHRMAADNATLRKILTQQVHNLLGPRSP